MFKTLSFKDLSVAYRGNYVFKNLSGEFTVGRPNLVIGRAGSGKSTLLQAISGFLKPETGKIFIDGQPFNAPGNFSLAFQNPETLFFNATVGEEVGFALKMRKLPNHEIEEKTRLWLSRWGLAPEHYWQKHPFELSGGEKRRVALAACTIFMPPVVLLDEPLAGLDACGQRDLAGMLEDFAREHIVITVTHEPEIFLGRCNQILFLQNDNALWLNTDEFLQNALRQPEFYPLPEWYSQALKHLPGRRELPLINAEAVFNYLNREKNDADQL